MKTNIDCWVIIDNVFTMNLLNNIVIMINEFSLILNNKHYKRSKVNLENLQKIGKNSKINSNEFYIQKEGIIFEKLISDIMNENYVFEKEIESLLIKNEKIKINIIKLEILNIKQNIK